MKKPLIKRLHEILIEIVKADDRSLDKIGVELLEIEKQLMTWYPEKKYLEGGE